MRNSLRDKSSYVSLPLTIGMACRRKIFESKATDRTCRQICLRRSVRITSHDGGTRNQCSLCFKQDSGSIPHQWKLNPLTLVVMDWTFIPSSRTRSFFVTVLQTSLTLQVYMCPMARILASRLRENHGSRTGRLCRIWSRAHPATRSRLDHHFLSVVILSSNLGHCFFAETALQLLLHFTCNHIIRHPCKECFKFGLNEAKHLR